MQQDRLIQNRIHRSFRRAEEQLLKALTARKGEVKVRVVHNCQTKGAKFDFKCFEFQIKGENKFVAGLT